MNIISAITNLKDRIDSRFRDSMMKKAREYAQDLPPEVKLELIEESKKMLEDYSFSRAIIEPGYILRNIPWTMEEIGAKRFIINYSINVFTEGIKLGAYLLPSYLIYKSLTN